MENQVDPNEVQPNDWYHKQLWRVPFPPDQARAAQLRCALAELKLYPQRDLALNPNLEVMEANYRAALPDMMAELDRSDLAALLQVARLLALVPRQPELFTRPRAGRAHRAVAR